MSKVDLFVHGQLSKNGYFTCIFGVVHYPINSIENVESKCACTLVTETHKCFNIFTPTSHCVL